MDFEKKRKEIFQQVAEKGWEGVDPVSCLVPGRKLQDKHSVHSEACGYNLWQSSYLATAWAMTGREKLAWKVLHTICDYQDTNPGSMTYGNFLAYSGWKKALDPNAISFIIPPLWYVYKHRACVMPVSLKRKLEKSFLLAAEALNAHRGGHLYYTNIILLNLACRLCIADIIKLPRVREVAGWEWEEWRNFILRMGFIPEYNAPGYTGVQLHALSIMLACDAPKDLHQEIRNVLRQLLADAVLNYHEKIGMLTGPQSRGHYIVRGSSLMDTIFHFVLGTPQPARGCHLWLGVGLSPEYLLPAVRKLSLPRTNLTFSPGYLRKNYLDQEFALGSVTSTRKITNPETPVFLAYASTNPCCGIAFVPAPRYESHFAAQKKEKLLSATCWLLTKKQIDTHSRGKFSGLNTGCPHTLVPERKFQPAYRIYLGEKGAVKIYDEQGKQWPFDFSTRKPLTEGLLLQTETIYAGIRFFNPELSAPVAKLSLQADHLVLLVESSCCSLQINRLEAATFFGLALQVSPVRKENNPCSLIPKISGIKRTRKGWKVYGLFFPGQKLILKIEPVQSVFYTLKREEITPHLFYLSDSCF